jgi:hypothetical protein
MKIKRHKAVYNEISKRVEFKEEHTFDVMFHTEWKGVSPGYRTSMTIVLINGNFVDAKFKKYTLIPNPDYDHTLSSTDPWCTNPEFIPVYEDFHMDEKDCSVWTKIPEGH